MSDDFMRDVLGFTDAPSGSTPHTGPHAAKSTAIVSSNAAAANVDNDEGDVPLFLRDDAGLGTGLASAAKAPPTGMNAPCFLQSDANESSGAAAGREASGASVSSSSPSAGGKRGSGTGALNVAVTGGAVSSAASLDFIGEHGLRWRLRREKILGKGSFGCATLYVQETTSAAPPPTSVSSSTSSASPVTSLPPQRVVVKDVNVQTMLNREEELASLRTEVDVMRRVLGHPSLVQLVDVHDDAQGPSMMVYLVLEYCAGGDLGMTIEKAQQDTLRGAAYVPESFAASMLIQMLVALHYLHVDQRILHRDVKPQNVFLLEDGVTVRLGDFGIATLLGQVGGKAKAACGSPFYMAPELCEERAYDGGADVWSLGVLLYELLALERPFIATTVPALTALVTRGKCVPLLERTELPYSRELKELVQSMLTVSPAARPTLRRLLRTSYVRQHLSDVPATVLQSAPYVALFGEAEVAQAVPRCCYPGVANPTQAAFSHHTAKTVATKPGQTDSATGACAGRRASRSIGGSVGDVSGARPPPSKALEPEEENPYEDDFESDGDE